MYSHVFYIYLYLLLTMFRNRIVWKQYIKKQFIVFDAAKIRHRTKGRINILLFRQ